MRKAAEERAERALTLLLQMLEQNFWDTGRILDDFEATHNDYELSISAQYSALVAGHFALKNTMSEIKKILNK